MSSTVDTLLDRRALATLPGLLRVHRDEAPHRARGKRLLQLLVLLVAAGLVGGGMALTQGHLVMGTSSELPWGVLIATYIFFVVSSTGVALVSSLGHVFNFRLFAPIAKQATLLALLLLGVGFAVIGADLERPFLLLRLALVSPNPSSPIWWMGTLYGLELLFIAGELFFLLTHRHQVAKVAGIAGILTAVAASSNLGSVFGLLHGRPYWFGPFTPVYFIATALLSGAAVLAILVYFTDHFTSDDGGLREEHRPLLEALGKLLALFAAIVLFFTAWRFVVGLRGDQPGGLVVMMAILVGPLFFSFWLVEIVVGLLIPLGMLLAPRISPPRIALAGVLTMIGVFVMRYNFVYAGQMLSLRPLIGEGGETLHYSPPFKGSVSGLLAYTPSWVELLVVVGALAAAILGYVLASRVLKVREEG